VLGHDGCSDRILPFLHLFWFFAPYVHWDVDIQAEIQGRMMVLIGGGGDCCGADAAIHSGGSGGGRFEETVRAYRGLLIVKTLQGSMTRLCSTPSHSLATRPSSRSGIWGIGRCVQMAKRPRGYHDICG